MYDRIGYAEKLEVIGFTDIKSSVNSRICLSWNGLPVYTVSRPTRQADYNARIERLTSEGIETVKLKFLRCYGNYRLYYRDRI